jgi:copper homeostasis protein CutC
MSGAVVVESCVDSLDAAVASAEGGAHRLELCANLEVGGTTPALALVRAVVAAVAIPVCVMVRPRSGSFVYTPEELASMVGTIEAVKATGAAGIVTGVLTPAGAIYGAMMRPLVALAHPLPVTCHRAFDEAPDLDAALDALIAIGVSRLLTSGGAPTAAEGAGTLARLVRRAEGRVAVIAGGQVRAHNVRALVEATGVREVHARIIREPGPADAATLERWRRDIAAFVAAAKDA